MPRWRPAVRLWGRRCLETCAASSESRRPAASAVPGAQVCEGGRPCLGGGRASGLLADKTLTHTHTRTLTHAHTHTYTHNCSERSWVGARTPLYPLGGGRHSGLESEAGAGPTDTPSSPGKLLRSRGLAVVGGHQGSPLLGECEKIPKKFNFVMACQDCYSGPPISPSPPLLCKRGSLPLSPTGFGRGVHRPGSFPSHRDWPRDGHVTPAGPIGDLAWDVSMVFGETSLLLRLGSLV